MTKNLSRRQFIKTVSGSAGLAVGAVAFSANSYARILGANDRVNFAVIGIHGRGGTHINSLAACSNARVTHICDVDSRELDKWEPRTRELFGRAAKRHIDIRKMLESSEIDAITIASPEHWHTPMAIMGLQAGKHVFVEKPPSHNPAEGELLIQAQKRYKHLVQMGNQQRSSDHTIEAIGKIHAGVIGNAYFGKAWYSNNRSSIGIGQKIPVPAFLDWELWQGPAPRQAYKDNVHPYNWHWFWNWGTGETLNNGTHEVDVCLWALDVAYPQKVSASGGRYHFKDDWEFYDTIVTTFEYPDKAITWEGKSCNGLRYHGRGRGVTIHGDKGTVLIDRNGYEIYDEAQKKIFEFVKPVKDVSMGVTGGGPMTDAHFQNFIDGIVMGDPIRSPIQEGNVSVTMLHLSNIAWRTGRTLKLDPANGHILNDDLAMETLWRREYEPGWEPGL